jgi:magnesium transporter
LLAGSGPVDDPLGPSPEDLAEAAREMAKPVVTVRILRRLLASGVHTRAERLLEHIHPADLGPLLADLTPDEIRTVIDLLFNQHRAATLLRELPPELLPQIIDAVTDQRLADVIARLEIDDMLEAMDAIPEDRRGDVRQLLPKVRQEELRYAELYPADSAGRVMTTNFLALDEKMTAQEGIDSIRVAAQPFGVPRHLMGANQHRQREVGTRA